MATIAHGVAPRPPFSAFPLLANKRTAFDRDAFTLAQRLSTVRQVATLLEGIYVHLWQKRAMCAPKVVRAGPKEVLAPASHIAAVAETRGGVNAASSDQRHGSRRACAAIISPVKGQVEGSSDE